ncbi:actin cortical patch SUR7/pH-response regulator pali [Rhexocercosporidium sp. MPI-PUGE-AT-0058]|nr:actin cortical patch SUR7/pH-response regulator pali [Rhexocercosporidium sp. MPI-PUGE-AT-0058]
MRITALFPLACAIVGFVLSMLCLFAGSKKAFMEEYHIITLNTSTLGHNILGSDDPSRTTTSSAAAATATSTAGKIGDFFSDIKDNVTDTIEDEFNDLVADVADRLAKELGIHQWYSLHLLDMCEGEYKPNATAKGASKNVTSCSNRTAMYDFDLDAVLNQQLEVGPLKINLSDINWPEDIQNGLDTLNVAFNAVFILYAIGIAAAGLAILTSLVAFFLHGSRLISFGNWGLASLSFISLLVSSALVTYVMNKAVHIINKYGNDVGAYASKGTKYLIITWVAVAVMFLASAAWVVEFFIGKRKQRREYTEKSHRVRGWGRSRRSDEAHLRRAGV